MRPWPPRRTPAYFVSSVVESGIVSVAVPLRGNGKHPPAAVSISCPRGRLEKATAPETVGRLMAARDAIDRDLALDERTDLSATS